MWTRTKVFKIAAKYVAPVVGLGALALAVYFYFYSPGQRVYRLRASAGNKLGMRHRLAELLKAEVADQNLQLELHETSGSEEALDKINNHTLDVALVQGGLVIDSRVNVRQVLALHMEAMHLLVKNELADAVAHNWRALEGKTVSLSEVGSGTHSLATDILAFAGLRARGPDQPKGYIEKDISRQQLFAEKNRDRIPDAFMLVSLLPSPSARYLVMQREFRLVPIPFGEAFALESLAPPQSDRGGQPAHSQIDKGHTYPFSIPAFACSVDPPVPTKPVPTIGTRLLLVAHKDVNQQAIRRLLEATLASKAAKNGHPPIDARTLELPPEFPWHAGTREYLARNTPMVSGVLMDAAQKGFAIFAAAASGLFVLWQWRRLRAQYLGGLSSYIGAVTQIEDTARQIERDQAGDRRQLVEMRNELGRLKSEAIDRLTKGEFTDRDLMQAFLVQINDVRDHLTRLIDQCPEKSHGQESGTPLPR
jgi:TRAP-type uncharacterized transport system substrate-binding protein